MNSTKKNSFGYINKLKGSLLLASGAVLQLIGLEAGEKLERRARTFIDTLEKYPKGLAEAVRFPLIEALYGRRARRFFAGAEIPDGPLKFKSQKPAEPLDEMEQLLLISTMTGNTGWHNMIYRAERYAPHLSNYALAASGRTFPSAAGFHTTEFFYTDDKGIYFIPTRDAPSLVNYNDAGSFDLNFWIEEHKKRIVKLSDKRLYLPAEPPYLEPHNTWCVNKPGTTLIIPVADIAQHLLGILCFLVQNGFCIYDDINNRSIPGMEKFRNLVDTENPYPLTFMEQYALTEATAEISTSCYAGMLMLQAMGLGGWMFDGIDRFSLLGASGNPDVPGLGFQYSMNEKYPLPDITGLPGIFEAYCPPNYKTMRDAVNAIVQRKFGKGGPYHKDTPGPWKDPSKIRSSAEIHSEEFIECVTSMAQYIYETFKKYPATVPAVFTLTYLQAHHLDLDFYNHYFKEGAYLESHLRHKDWWHRQKP